jgi:hypothetical protein
LLTGCVTAPAAPGAANLAPPATPTLITRPTRLPTATAAVFEMRSTGTPTPTLSGLQAELLPGFGYGPAGFPAEINPLTGLHVSDPGLLDRRPMVIKITNFPRSVRPQWGLTLADHIYEYYLEDELTRFIAIFYGQDAERVGPIRSGRPFDEHIVRMYKGFFAFAFADDRLIELWEDSDITPFLVIERPGNCPPMCRIGSQDNYNSLFTDTKLLDEYVDNRAVGNQRQDLNGLRFERSSLITMGGGDGSRVEIRYSPSSYHFWEYQPDTLRYYRWQDTDRTTAGGETYEPLFDSLTAQQVYADNLIVLFAPLAYFFKSNSTEIYDIQLINSGKGYALREGKIFDILWRRPSREGLIWLTFPNGSPFPLKPGNVWFEVLSDISPHLVSGPTWKFQFEIPADLPVPTPTPKKKKSP